MTADLLRFPTPNSGSKAVHFIVRGIPKTAGSKKFVGMRNGRAILVDDSGPKGKKWRRDVAYEAKRAMFAREKLEGPLVLCVTFVMPRPKGHFGTGRNASKLKSSAPVHHTIKPDATKLLRAVEDAMTGIVYHDDSQIVVQRAEKIYGPNDGIGASIAVGRLDDLKTGSPAA